MKYTRIIFNELVHQTKSLRYQNYLLLINLQIRIFIFIDEEFFPHWVFMKSTLKLEILLATK